MNLTQSIHWAALQKHFDEDLKNTRVDQLFAQADRFEHFSFKFDQLFIDFSKQKISEETLKLLINLADSVGLKKSIQQLLYGDKVNFTEERSVLHTASRLAKQDSLVLDGKDINQSIQAELDKVESLVDKITSGNWLGYSGKPITDVVNIGVGGSDLGPLLVCDALDEFKSSHAVNVHFASTIDGSQVAKLFKVLNPETTLFVIVSKSFTTIDTFSNVDSAKSWLLEFCDDENVIRQKHFMGISTKPEKMTAWGIDTENQLLFWDWVGGRFSLWSSVGFCIALKLGMDNFRELLAGAKALDDHFLNTSLDKNLPVLMGLISLWNSNFLSIETQTILPYDARLKYFPDYLTQLEMESNGKSVNELGQQVDYKTCPILWGEVGPNAQHAFYQLLHQGTHKVASDFILPIKRYSNPTSDYHQKLQEQHNLTIANCLAQSRALMTGGNSSLDSDEELLKKHKNYPGDQPSTTILIEKLSPYSLGQLIALYEHKVFVMGKIWGINSFDQWGVELGKVMANETLEALKSNHCESVFDDSTKGLICRINNQE